MDNVVPLGGSNIASVHWKKYVGTSLDHCKSMDKSYGIVHFASPKRHRIPYCMYVIHYPTHHCWAFRIVPVDESNNCSVPFPYIAPRHSFVLTEYSPTASATYWAVWCWCLEYWEENCTVYLIQMVWYRKSIKENEQQHGDCQSERHNIYLTLLLVVVCGLYHTYQDYHHEDDDNKYQYATHSPPQQH